MAYDLIEIRHDNRHLHVRLEGAFDRETAETVIADVIARYNTDIHSGLLIDSSQLVIHTSDVDHYHYIKTLIRAGYRKVGRLAYLESVKRRAINEFFEDAARNQGLQVRFFYGDVQPATEWLAELVS